MIETTIDPREKELLDRLGCLYWRLVCIEQEMSVTLKRLQELRERGPMDQANDEEKDSPL